MTVPVPTAPPRLLLTTGPTREYLDDVRYLSNASTGRMGAAIAAEALTRGWRVEVVAGPCEASLPGGAACHAVVSAQEMFEVVRTRVDDCDVFIAAAAVADYRPARRAPGKMRKSTASVTMELEPTDDILAWVGERRPRPKVIVGFALEAMMDEALAREKLRRKGCDLLALNTAANIGADSGEVALLGAEGTLFRGPASKTDTARRICAAVEQLLADPTRRPS